MPKKGRSKVSEHRKGQKCVLKSVECHKSGDSPTLFIDKDSDVYADDGPSDGLFSLSTLPTKHDKVCFF
jgi:hypothetical protein